MRLIYICQDGEAPSGVATYGYQVLEHVPESRMLLLNARRHPPTMPEQLAARVSLVPAERSHDANAVAEELRAMLEAEPGRAVILPNTGDTPWTAMVRLVHGLSPAARGGLRVIGVVHSDVETQYAGAERHAAFASTWIGVSRRIGDELRRRILAPGTRVHTLNYPIAIPPATAGCGNDSGKLRVVYLGRLEELQKRVSRLVDVFEKLRARGVPYEVRIAGDGPARETFAAAVAASPVAGDVRLLGAVDPRQRDAVLADSDVVVLTSEYEGLPLALLEAMAAGVCPVVMSVASGIGEAVDETCGLVVPQGDTDAMASAIARLHDDRRMLDRLKAAARDRVLGHFAPEAHFAAFQRILEECWHLPAPDPGAHIDDPTQTSVARLVAQARGVQRPVAVYGAGMFGRKVIDACADAGLDVCAWFDSDPARAGASYRGLTCRAPEDTGCFSDALFLVGSLQFREAIAQRIRSEFAGRGLDAPEIHLP